MYSLKIGIKKFYFLKLSLFTVWFSFRENNVILWILQMQDDPAKVCSSIGVCTFDRYHGVKAGIRSVVDRATSGVSDAMCTYCELAVTWMENQISQNKTVDEIINYVDKVKLIPILQVSIYSGVFLIFEFSINYIT
jgi:Saposin-like type B, region 1